MLADEEQRIIGFRQQQNAADQKSCGIKLWLAMDGDDRAAQVESLLASISSFTVTTYHPITLSASLVQFIAVLKLHYLQTIP